ncbi:MAG: hypothetical protein RL368_1574 [Pseudomonadota bacterium]|jgi:sulfite exporter TauE/SafE
MENSAGLISAFLMGLLGSVHCFGMCGGIVGALTMGLPAQLRQSPQQLLPYLLTYNIGRIASYSLAGALIGFLGGQFANALPMDSPHAIAKWFTTIFLIILGLYIGSWWQALSILEKWGSHLWRKIEPIGKRFLPVTHPMQALGLGLVWGWLPCGLVYSALALALTSGSAFNGGALMFSFGLGTLPMLLAIGTTAHWLNQWTKRLSVRRAMGAIIIGLGIYSLVAPHNHGNHAGHAGHEHAESTEHTEHAGHDMSQHEHSHAGH